MRSFINNFINKLLSLKFKPSYLIGLSFYFFVIVFAVRSFILINIPDLSSFTPETLPFIANLLEQLGITNIIITLFRFLGFTQLLVSLMYLIISLVNRKLIPLLLFFMLLDQALRIRMTMQLNFALENSNNSVINWAIAIGISVILFVLLTSKVMKSISSKTKRSL